MALVLGCKRNETIMIGDDVSVTVASIENGLVKLAFDAPRDVVIDRMKIYLRKREERGEQK